MKEELEPLREKLETLRKELNERIDKILATEKAPEFEKGKWYHGDNENYKRVFKFSHHKGDNIHFSEMIVTAQRGDEVSYYTNNWVSPKVNGEKYRPATPSEIESALIAEAKKRGFKEGVMVKAPWYSSPSSANESPISVQYENYNGGDEYGVRMGGGCIYANGVWAEIIKDEAIKIDRYPVVFDKDDRTVAYTTIDGHTFTKDFWRAAQTVARHSKAKVKIGCSHQFDLPLETINKILSKL